MSGQDTSNDPPDPQQNSLDMSINNNIVKIIDNITKSKNDLRNYRGLVLKNGLTVLLISDPKVRTSAASMSVAVGTLSDPKNLNGLANLCSYMLSLSTPKYSEENGFETFLIRNNGYFTTHIGPDYTKYNFCVDSGIFKNALDRFGQFFKGPLFREAKVKMKIIQILLQHEQNKNDESKRIDHMIRNVADPNHPIYRKYGTGTRRSLWDYPIENNFCICEKLRQFMQKWYSSHLMYLTVLGKEDLHTLGEMVISIFGELEKRNVDMPYWNEPIYKTEQLSMKTMVVPLRDINELHVIFPLPDQARYYKSKPIWYLSFIFQHEGPTSILGVLKKKGWCSKLYAWKQTEARGIDIYRIKMHLTSEGIVHVDDIIKLIFQYVNMLKHIKKLPKWYYEEYRHTCELQFNLQERIKSINYVSQLSLRMITVELEDVLTASELLQDWRPELTSEVLSHIRIDNMGVIVVSKEFQNIANTVDDIFRTSYATIKIPVETLEMWQEDDMCYDLTMPPRNKFITTNTKLVKIDEYEPNEPEIYYESKRLKCWFKKDTRFRLPKSFITINFFCKSVITDIFEFAVKYLFLELLKDDFEYCTTAARNANIHVNIKSTNNGFLISFNGFDQKMHILLKEFINKFTTYTIDPVRFKVVIENIMKEMNDTGDRSSYHAPSYHQMILFKRSWASEQIKNAIKDVTIELVEEFINTFQTHVRMNMLVYGNVNKKRALMLTKILEKPFKNLDTLFDLEPLKNFEESNLLEENETDSIHLEVRGQYLSTSSVSLLYYCGIYSTRVAVIIKLLNVLVNSPLWRFTRIEFLADMQPSFVMHNMFNMVKDGMFLNLTIKSIQRAAEIAERVEEFLEDWWRLVFKMQSSIFEHKKKLLKNQLLSRPSSMPDQMEMYNYELAQHNTDFNRAKKEADELMSVTKSDVFRIFRRHIRSTGLRRHKFSIYVHASQYYFLEV